MNLALTLYLNAPSIDVSFNIGRDCASMVLTLCICRLTACDLIYVALILGVES